MNKLNRVARASLSGKYGEGAGLGVMQEEHPRQRGQGQHPDRGAGGLVLGTR